MGECDRCGEDVNARVTLRNVKASGGVVSSITSRMQVCFDCRDYMRESDAYEL